MKGTIFGSVDELSEVADRSLKLGRLVAVQQFSKALVRHGHFDEYRFYCASLASLRSAQERIERLLKPEELERVQLTLQPNLHADFASAPFGAIHNAGGWTALASLAPARNQFAPEPFPVTCLIHSLNDPNAYLKALKLALSDCRPYDAIVCSSEAGRKTVRAFFEALRKNFAPSLRPEFPGEIAKIPLGVDEEQFRPLDRGACRKSLGLPEKAVLLLQLGRLSAHDKSDPAPLFYLFRRLCREKPDLDLRLLLAGGADPENLASFEKTCREIGIAERVIFRPNFEDEEKPLLYGACDLFVSLADSLQETFGIAVAEAMASGRPVVVSDFDGYRELVENGKSGFAIPTRWGPADGFLRGVSSLMNPKVYQLFLSQSIAVDVPSLAVTLGSLVDSPERRAAAGEQARRRAVERFSWKVVIGEYERLWEELRGRAESSEAAPEPRPDPFAVDYFRCFSHFPTEIVGSGWKVSLTPFGREAIAGNSLPAAYGEIAVLISVDWLKVLIERLLAGPANVVTLLELSKQKLDSPPPEHVLYHILWLAKYDVVSLSP